MCTRYSLTNRETDIFISEIAVLVATAARYNIGPGTLIKTIIRGPYRYEISEMMWGWQRANNAGLLVNGKSENLHTAFNSIKHQRCLIPADGFYEWTGPKNERQPIRFTKPDNQPFCFAGLWKDIPAESGNGPAIRRHVIVLTTTPNDTVGKFHERMPFIIPPDQYGDWLANGKRFEKVIEQPDRGELEFCPVQPALNKASNDGLELIRPYTKQQQELF